MKIVNRLQQSTGNGTGIGTCNGTGTCIDVGEQGVDYCLTVGGLGRFRDMIYVPDISKLKKVILKEFHAKPYSGHPIYQKKLTVVKKIYYWSNLKKGVVDFVARW